MPRDTETAAHPMSVNELALEFAENVGEAIDRHIRRGLPAQDRCIWPGTLERQKRIEIRLAVAQMLVGQKDDCLRDLIAAYRAADYALSRNVEDPDAADDADDAIAQFRDEAEAVAQYLAGEIRREGAGA